MQRIYANTHTQNQASHKQNSLGLFLLLLSKSREYKVVVSSQILFWAAVKQSQRRCILEFKIRIQTVSHYGRFIELRKYIISRFHKFSLFP